jgi:adenosylhomocysteine nucleosidase
MPKLAIVAALEREVSGLTKNSRRLERQHQGRNFVFFERKGEDKDDKDKDKNEDMVIVCGGIGLDSARRAAEAVIALYHPTELQSVGFAGALDQTMHVGDLFIPSAVIDARDGSRIFTADVNNRNPESGDTLVTFNSVAGAQQKTNLAQAFGAKAVDMEAAAVAAAATAHRLGFAATKVISDELEFELPQMERFVDARGQFRTAAFVAFFALRPWLWPRVAALARNSRKAAQALGSYFAQLNREQNLPLEANTH